MYPSSQRELFVQSSHFELEIDSFFPPLSQLLLGIVSGLYTLLDLGKCSWEQGCIHRSKRLNVYHVVILFQIKNLVAQPLLKCQNYHNVINNEQD